MLSKFISSFPLWYTSNASREITPVTNDSQHNAEFSSTFKTKNELLAMHRPDMGSNSDLPPEAQSDYVLSNFILDGKAQPEDMQKISCFCISKNFPNALSFLTVRMGRARIDSPPTLDLSRCAHLTMQDWKMFIEWLKKTPETIHLILSNNDLGDDFAVEFAKLLKLKPLIASIDLSGNKIGDEGAKAICEALDQPAFELQLDPTIYLDWHNIDTRRGLETTNISNQTLTRLDLRWNRIGEEGVQALNLFSQFNSAFSIDTHYNPGMFRNFHDRLEIDLSESKLSIEDCENLVEWLDKLSLDKHAKNIFLDLSGNNIGDEGAKIISKALSSNQQLITIDLGSNSIGPEGIKALCDSLESNKKLASLQLYKNNIGKEGIAAVRKLLLANQTLNHLDIAKCCLECEDIVVVCEALKQNTTLESLCLQGNIIGPLGAEAIGEMLKSNQALTLLFMQNGYIGPIGTQLIGNGLKLNRRLTKLHLGNNYIGTAAIQEFSKALRENKSLTSLILRENHIDDDGVAALREVLQCNQTLKHLVLCENIISQRGINMMLNMDIPGHQWKMDARSLTFRKKSIL